MAVPADQTRARADRGARTGIAGGAADDGTQRRAAQGAADRAVGLFMAGGLARRDIAGARRGIAAAEQIARPLRPGRCAWSGCTLVGRGVSGAADSVA